MQNLKEIYLAGGCFRGVDAYFKTIEGIVETEVGYANGNTEETAYPLLKITGHAETVKIKYDPAIISLEKILEYFYYVVDPFSINRQGNDFGSQYRTGIYSKDPKDLEFARKFLEKKQEEADQNIEIEVKKIKNYQKAEEYHQNYLEKNPTGYCHINLNDKPSL